MTESSFPETIAVDDPPDVPAAASGEAGPVQPRERMVLVDVLRGFALLGIIQVNFDGQNAGDALDNLLEFFVDGSFIAAFSFLFGLGFAIQLVLAEEAKRPFIFRFLWRTLILFFIGTIYFIFIRPMVIIIDYALLAPLLLVVRRWRPKLILALAAGILVFSMSPRLPEGQIWTRVNPEQVETERLQMQLTVANAQANPPVWCQMIPGLTDAYRENMCSRATRVRTLLTQELATVGWWKSESAVLFMFLLGLYAGRRRVLHDAAQHTRFFGWVAGIALAFGLAGSSLYVFGDFFADKGITLPKFFDGWRLAQLLGNIGMSLFYLAGVTLLFTHWGRARRVLAPLAFVGRMTLTNYLMQYLILMTVLGDGFGLVIRVDNWLSLLLVNAFFGVQILYSYWWFRYFRFGPVEWVWRSLTWFRIQPMLIGTRPEQEEFRKLDHG